MVIDLDAKRRFRRARAFFAFMLGLSLTAFVLDGPRLITVDVALFVNSMVWVALTLEYTYQLSLLTLHDMDP